jgi:predicted nucleic acid-binding protein
VIILDTNIISEMMKPLPSQELLSWMDRQATDILYLTSISIAEIMYGLGVLPKGKRRSDLEQAFSSVKKEAFMGRILSFDEKSADFYGELMGNSKMKGRVMSFCDGQIAAIVKQHGFCLATRNIKDFSHCGIMLINPFATH